MDPRLELAFLVNQTATCLNHEADLVLQDHFDITYTHYLALVGLTYMQPCTQKRLAAFAQVTSAGMKHILQALEDLDLVQKRTSEQSRREVTITMTAKGRAKYKKINCLLAERLQQILVLTDKESLAISYGLKRQLSNLR